MTELAEMNRAEVANWLFYHSPLISEARDKAEAAVREYATLLARCNGAFEYTRTTPASFTDAMMEAGDRLLAEEVRRDLQLD